jgi:hypothetical protein
MFSNPKFALSIRESQALLETLIACAFGQTPARKSEALILPCKTVTIAGNASALLLLERCQLSCP